ncbi:MAG: histidinol-phosphate transaminase [Oscillospiraceae bacterium]
MYKLNAKLEKLVPYDPIQGDYRIRLDANESFFDANTVLGEKIARAVAAIPLNRYPDPYAAGTVAAFAAFYGVNPALVTAGNGSDELISIITSTFLEKGDKLAVLSADFSMYAFYGAIYENKPLVFPKNADLTVDVDKLAAFCTEENVRMLIFSNPCNPTSLGIDRAAIRRLLGGVPAHCLVVLDEAYMDFWTETMLDEMEDYSNLIILKTCSKAVGMAAVRLGFAVAGKSITRALKAVKSPYNTDAISQTLGELIFQEQALLRAKTAELTASRAQLYAAVRAIAEQTGIFETVYESVTNFVFAKTAYADEIFQFLLDNSVAVRKFDGFLRITAGSQQENAVFIQLLAEAAERFSVK